MAKVKFTGRKASTQPKSEVGELTREETLKHMCALGMNNDVMWGAMEAQFPAIICDDAERKRKGGNIPFDPKMYKAIREQMRSVKGIYIKEDKMLEGMIASANSTVKSIDETEFQNRRRWKCGWSALDYIFGETKYIHPNDAKNSKYKPEIFEYFDSKSGTMVKTKVQVWIGGDWKKGDPMCYDAKGKLILSRIKGNLVGEEVRKLQKIEKGLPEGYFGFIGGEAGVGKSRAMIELTHAVNRTGRLVHYYDGEAGPADFRSWCGASVNAQLFRVFHGGVEGADLVPISVIENCALKEKPSLIIIDSFQMLAEANKANAGQKRALARLRKLKLSEEAGRPTIIIISQLNKKQELAGLKFLEHMVDFSIRVFKRQGHKNQFFMESMKMRGAESKRGQLFKHSTDGVICLNTEHQQSYDLIQRSSLPAAVQQGVNYSQPIAPLAPNGLPGLTSDDVDSNPNTADTPTADIPEIIQGDAGSLV